jgi:excisionase family DNA binding protein
MAKKNKSAQDRRKVAAPTTTAMKAGPASTAVLPINAPEAAKPATCASKFSTVEEAAEFLHICRASVHNGIRKGLIPALRIGKVVRIPTEWLDDQARIARIT